MPIYRLPQAYVFPDPRLADEHGLLAVGGDLHPERLLLAYANGIFPWPSHELPLAWFSPDPRMLLFPGEVVVSRSLRRSIRRRRFEVRADTAFAEVMRACADARRGHTWITDEMFEAYTRLHALGFAHSIEVYARGELVGGLYGVSLGGTFCGESMFHYETDASKAAFVALARQTERWGFHFVDCQLPTEHLASLGARPVPRDEYLELLRGAMESPGRRGRWHLDRDLLADLSGAAAEPGQSV